ncbi:SHOCT domain-containing protein [Deinococcus sp. 6GRE01]|uniref:SHOCT domain-containing protein n=1 Tax=Deinococcus sp. 6GRE01 TaxID=2745873 RepID=UPI001E57F2B7|nr:SHOCT domain-containing protein [Deinococcus sp. 6GRE01]MCD0156317.1 SHOCT domain-containing protein [Deinococcus sp. 6GRE01]
MFEFTLVLVLVTTIWMTYDSAQLKIPVDSKPYSMNNGAPAWFLSGLLLWIATFPYYLVKRSKVTGGQAVAPAAPVAQASLSEELTRLAAMRESGQLSEGDYERAKAKLLR